MNYGRSALKDGVDKFRIEEEKMKQGFYQWINFPFQTKSN